MIPEAAPWESRERLGALGWCQRVLAVDPHEVRNEQKQPSHPRGEVAIDEDEVLDVGDGGVASEFSRASASYQCAPGAYYSVVSRTSRAKKVLLTPQ
jgi:hypothetical protein